jgi:hypothetical protein
MRNAFFTFLYPGRQQGDPPAGWPQIAIPFSGEFVSISGDYYGGESGSAVFYDPQQFRDLASCLDEAADLFEAARAKPKGKR